MANITVNFKIPKDQELRTGVEGEMKIPRKLKYKM
jgi:hypothetical protein